MEKRLFRNEHDKVLAGVSSGIAEYMEVDVTIIRLLFVLSTIFLVGTGILVYIIMWIVVPVNTDPTARFSKFNEAFKNQNNPFQSTGPGFGSQKSTTENTQTYQDWTSSSLKDDGFSSWKQSGNFKPYQKNNETGRTVAGLFLLVIGLYFLMDEFGMVPFWFQITKLWPLVFVAIGASFILKSKNKNAWENWRDQNFQGGSKPENPVIPEPPVVPGNSISNNPTITVNDAGIDDPFKKKED